MQADTLDLGLEEKQAVTTESGPSGVRGLGIRAGLRGHVCRNLGKS